MSVAMVFTAVWAPHDHAMRVPCRLGRCFSASPVPNLPDFEYAALGSGGYSLVSAADGYHSGLDS